MPRRNLYTTVAVAVLSALCWARSPGIGGDDEKYEFYRVLVDALDHIESSYVEDVDRKKLLQGALEGMLQNLDPYSNYIPPTNLGQFQKQTEGHFSGVGINVTQDIRTRQLVVISPLVGTPAYRGGILAGDRIVKIDGESTENMSLDDAVSRIMGEENTPVTLTVIHKGQTKPLDIKLNREQVKLETVMGDLRKPDDSWDWIVDKDAKIAYVRVTQFVGPTADDLTSALKQARSEGMRGLILDLRFNPGGLLQSAIDVSELFLKADQLVVSTKGRNSGRDYKAQKDGPYRDTAVAVLVNQFSASASEIVSAALQDHKRAVVVGERTWGKGSVQNIIELEGGKSALKLTTAEYHRPSGHNIHRREKAKETDEWGVMPSPGCEVKTSDEEEFLYTMWRRNRDVLRRGTADKPEKVKEDEPKKDETKKDESKKDEPKKDEAKKDEPKKGETKKDEPKKSDVGPDQQPATATGPTFDDKQLKKALELLREQLMPAVAKP
jgi:carboxyl-terminal processing protease